MFLKAWNGEYEDAEEAMRHVKAVIEKMNAKLVGQDEISLRSGKMHLGLSRLVIEDGIKRYSSGRSSRLVFPSEPTSAVPPELSP